MKKFSQLTEQEQIQLLKRDENLRNKLDNYVQDCEMDWLSDKLACVKPGLSDWEYGFYNRNFYRLGDLDKFVEGVQKSIYNFGSTDKLKRLADQCEKLQYTNLYEHHVKKLASLYFEEEIDMIVEYTENVCYKIYCNDIESVCADGYLEPFFDNLSEYLINEETNTYYKPCKISA